MLSKLLLNPLIVSFETASKRFGKDLCLQYIFCINKVKRQSNKLLIKQETRAAKAGGGQECQNYGILRDGPPGLHRASWNPSRTSRARSSAQRDSRGNPLAATIL